MHAYLPVTDLARARNFYEQKLGFKPRQEMPAGVIYEFDNGTASFMMVLHRMVWQRFEPLAAGNPGRPTWRDRQQLAPSTWTG